MHQSRRGADALALGQTTCRVSRLRAGSFCERGQVPAFRLSGLTHLARVRVCTCVREVQAQVRVRTCVLKVQHCYVSRRRMAACMCALHNMDPVMLPCGQADIVL